MTSPVRSLASTGAQRLLEAVVNAGAVLGSLCILGILVSYSTEVFMRYMLAAPTAWASDFVTYFLCGAVFLIMPRLSADGAHVAVTVLAAFVPPRLERSALVAGLVISAAVCLFTGWLAGVQTQYNYVRGIDTMSLVAIPKWIVLAPICYGFTLSGIVLAVQALKGGAAPDQPGQTGPTGQAGQTGRT